jgi:hydrogenase expression/formation protein HypE
MSGQDFPEMQGPVCPVPIRTFDTIVMGHGSGGLMTRELIARVFQPHFSNPALLANNDFAAIFTDPRKRLVISTDAHIVSPLFFPGGDIGRLAVSGTVNDIAVSGGTPVCLTASFIIEEGFPISDLERIVHSMAETALEAGVSIVAGDTKVVERGKADGVFISTTGVAEVDPDIEIGGANAVPGDAVILTGTLGDHGIAVLSARGELGLSSSIRSDVAPLNSLVAAVVQKSRQIHVMRDPTRGGLATTLNEIALQSSLGITINEGSIPVKPEVASACEMLGFDPLYVANEGKLIIVLPAAEAEAVLQAVKAHPYGIDACVIGHVHQDHAGSVLLKTRIGGTRLLSVMSGEMLPRIC